MIARSNTSLYSLTTFNTIAFVFVIVAICPVPWIKFVQPFSISQVQITVNLWRRNAELSFLEASQVSSDTWALFCDKHKENDHLSKACSLVTAAQIISIGSFVLGLASLSLNLLVLFHEPHVARYRYTALIGKCICLLSFIFTTMMWSLMVEVGHLHNLFLHDHAFVDTSTMNYDAGIALSIVASILTLASFGVYVFYPVTNLDHDLIGISTPDVGEMSYEFADGIVTPATMIKPSFRLKGRCTGMKAAVSENVNSYPSILCVPPQAPLNTTDDHTMTPDANPSTHNMRAA